MKYHLLQQNIMRKNDVLAAKLRARFIERGTFVVNLLSSPGAGKTTLLEVTFPRLRDRYRVGALVGDQATDNDARRLERAGAPVRQITTGVECRLDAAMVGDALDDWEGSQFDFLVIENVGNLICPAEYDLGEDLRAVLFSVTEGEDKPLKYPLAFNTAHVVLLTKIDLAEATGFDRGAARRSIEQVHPGVPILEISARTGAGLGRWTALLEEQLAQKTGAPALSR